MEIKLKRYYRWTDDFKSSKFDAKKGDLFIAYCYINGSTTTYLSREPISPYLLSIGVKDKEGRNLYNGDIVQEGVKGEVIWGGEGKIIEPPIGCIYYNAPFFDVKTIKLGVYEREGEQIRNLHMNEYDGVFQWIPNESILIKIGNKFVNPELLEKPCS